MKSVLLEDWSEAFSVFDHPLRPQNAESIRGLKVSFGSEELAQTKDLGDSYEFLHTRRSSHLGPNCFRMS